MLGENKQSDEYAISFSEGPCIATSGLVITTKLRDKVDIGRCYQENLVFDFPAIRRIPGRIFFFGTIFLRCIIFKRSPYASENY